MQEWIPVVVDLMGYKEWYSTNHPKGVFLFEPDIACQMKQDYSWDGWRYIQQNNPSIAGGWIPSRFVKPGHPRKQGDNNG